MDQQLNNGQNEFLWTLLANPADDAHLYAYNLQRLVNDFPQSGILQALLAHASDNKNLRQASVYFNAKSLYKLVNAPSTFIGVPGERIIIQGGGSANDYYRPVEQQPADESLIAAREENVIGSIKEGHFDSEAVKEPVAETAAEDADQAPGLAVNHVHHESAAIPEHPAHEPVSAEHGAHESETSNKEEQPLNAEITDEHHLTQAEGEVAESVAVTEPGESLAAEYPGTVTADAETPPPVPESVHTYTEVIQTEPELNNTMAESGHPVEAGVENRTEATIAVPEETVVETPEEEPEKHIVEETFDEIVGIEEINIGEGHGQPFADVHENSTEERPGPEVDGEENLIKENIAATDFFMFDRAFGEHKQTEQSENGRPASAANSRGTTGAPDHQDVSKYHDEKMPYTFMWWLDKTRKEHSGIYQPYIKAETVNINNKPKRPADELQQQYFENIFHITSIDELDKGTAAPAAPFNIKRKEQVIIDRFIKEEPQIKPQSSDKLDNENKAKKSSEDRDEIVTETLAGIYSDQMLYHKAIASYKKLMLKFPEKSRYFAGKIEQLEKKTN